jgi:hypothetical protein
MLMSMTDVIESNKCRKISIGFVDNIHRLWKLMCLYIYKRFKDGYHELMEVHAVKTLDGKHALSDTLTGVEVALEARFYLVVDKRVEHRTIREVVSKTNMRFWSTMPDFCTVRIRHGNTRPGES